MLEAPVIAINGIGETKKEDATESKGKRETTWTSEANRRVMIPYE